MTPLPAIAPEHRVSRPDSRRRCAAVVLVCQHPSCRNRVADRHHIVPRSALNGAYDYVLIDDKEIINIAFLCWQHHDDLESQPGGVKSRLRFLGHKLEWGWYNRGDPSLNKYENGDHIIKELIWWHDPKTSTSWIFKGFLDGLDRA